MALHSAADVRAAPYRALLTAEELLRDDGAIDEGLHLKHDHQLPLMRQSHDDKRAKMAGKRLQAFSYPDSIRWPLKKDGLADAVIEVELVRRQEMYSTKLIRLREVVQRLDDEIALRAGGKVERDPLGTQYYIDADNGNDANDGLGIGGGNAWKTMDEFTENARAAGDIATCRRGATATYDLSGSLAFTSDGGPTDPIILEADFDDYWSDEVDLSATGTATFVFGSKTINFSADISGVLAAGDWIYASGDDNRNYAYEVDTVVTTTVVLFLPYKGDQAGSGKTSFNMQSAPAWDVPADTSNLAFNMDNYWLLHGLNLNGNSLSGLINFDSAVHHRFVDCTLIGSGTGGGVRCTDDVAIASFHKCRLFHFAAGVQAQSGTGTLHGFVFTDCLMDMNSQGSSTSFIVTWGMTLDLIDCELKNALTGDFNFLVGTPFTVRTRNTTFSSGTVFNNINAAVPGGQVFNEDFQGTPGNTQVYSGLSQSESTPNIQSETGTVRSGGNPESIKVTPSDDLAVPHSQWAVSSYTLFDYPIFLEADAEKTFTVFFAAADNADWDVNPTTAELHIEVEYWGHATNAARRRLRSTGSVDFITDTDFDQSLSVTFTPLQSGLAYIKCVYGKKKETAKDNLFFADPAVVIS